MMKKEMSKDSASLEPDTQENSHKERMLKYKFFSMAFSYPDENFFAFFSDFALEKEKIIFDYDSIFRDGKIWLYGAEHLSENEFQRANCLSDIMGFYKAFGIQPDSDRPDALTSELEFMHYLIFKQINAPSREKALICFDAQKKFFAEHLYPAAKKISENIVSYYYYKIENGFYLEAAESMREFLESEKEILK